MSRVVTRVPTTSPAERPWIPAAQRPSANLTHQENRALRNTASRRHFQRLNRQAYQPGSQDAPRNKRGKAQPVWRLDQHLTSIGLRPPTRDSNGGILTVSTAVLRAICKFDRYYISPRFTFNFLRYSEPLPRWVESHGHTGIHFDSPYRLDREFDWRLIAHTDRTGTETNLRHERETPWWGKMHSGIGYVAYGPLDNPLFVFCEYRNAALLAAKLAAFPPLSARRTHLMQTAFRYLPRNAGSTDWVETAQPAYHYKTLLEAALPLTPETSYHVTRQRALHLSGCDFRSDITFNLPLMAFCDQLTEPLILQCITLRQYQEYKHVWKRLPERPAVNREWTDIIYHSDAPEYKRTRAVISSIADNTDWEYHQDAPDNTQQR